MIDPAIPLAASPGPAPLNPVQTLAGIGQLRQQQQQQEAGSLEIQQRRGQLTDQQRARDQQTAVDEAWKAAFTPNANGVLTLDRAKLTEQLTTRGQGHLVPGLTKTLDEADEATAKRQKALLDVDESTNDIIGGMAYSVNHAGNTPEAFTTAVQYLLQNKTVPAEKLQPFIQAAQANPSAIAGITQKLIDLSPKYKKQATEDAQQAATAARDQANQANTVADNARADKAATETNRHNVEMEKAAAARARASAGGGTVDDADAIANSIIDGDQPPVLTGLYRLAGPVRSALAKKGYKLADAMTDWNATQKHIATLNGSQQTRMRQAVDNAYHSIDVIEDLAKQWAGGRFPILNRAELKLAKGGALGAQAQQIATQLEAQISDVTSELGNVYMGGNSPTDHALGLAGKNLSADWTQDQLLSALKLARTNLQIRSNSMKNVGPAGASATNPYAAPDTSVTGPGTTAPKDGTEGSVNGVPAIWKTVDGKAGWYAK